MKTLFRTNKQTIKVCCSFFQEKYISWNVENWEFARFVMPYTDTWWRQCFCCCFGDPQSFAKNINFLKIWIEYIVRQSIQKQLYSYNWQCLQSNFIHRGQSSETSWVAATPVTHSLFCFSPPFYFFFSLGLGVVLSVWRRKTRAQSHCESSAFPTQPL